MISKNAVFPQNEMQGNCYVYFCLTQFPLLNFSFMNVAEFKAQQKCPLTNVKLKVTYKNMKYNFPPFAS